MSKDTFFALGILAGLMIAAWALGRKSFRNKHYDEMQMKIRAMGYRIGFFTALALALGLSDTVQAQSGAVRIEAMFIDEGFGTLDENALRSSLRVLSDLADGKRLIGIISHVRELEERIDSQIIVTKTLRGSKLRVTGERLE